MIKERLNDRWARMFVIPVIALAINLTGNDIHQVNGKNIFTSFLICVVYVTCYWEFNRLFFDYILKRFPQMQSGKKRAVFQLGFMVGFVLLTGILLDIVNFSIPEFIDQISFFKNYNKTVERSLFCLAVITVIFESIYFYTLYETVKIENQRLREEVLASRLMERIEYKTRFLVKSGETFTAVVLSDIAYFSYEDKLTFLYTNAGKRYMLDSSLEELEKTLNPKLFFRLNRQYLSSFAAVKSVHNYFNSKLKIYLSPDAAGEIIVSKERSGSLKAWLDA